MGRMAHTRGDECVDRGRALSCSQLDSALIAGHRGEPRPEPFGVAELAERALITGQAPADESSVGGHTRHRDGR